MAPSGGHLLVPKALRIVKFAVTQAGALIRSKLPQASTGATNTVLQPIYLHSKSQPIHPRALLKQSRSAALRNFSSQARLRVQHATRPSFQVSKIGQAVTRSFGSPFASTLRPNLTGGALPRSAGGYGLGGTARGVRHFGHTGGAQAQVIQNVGAGMRAFCIGGGKARFDGFDQKTGVKRFKAVSEAEDCALRIIQKSASVGVRGTCLEFRLAPTITALSASTPTSTRSSLESQPLATADFLDNLSVDFARALKDLSATLTDLKRLAALGDLPISLTKPHHGGTTLCVRFPGCDAETVSRLCDEVGVRRGVVREDEAWSDDKDVEMALLFPFAPSKPASDSNNGSAQYPETIHADDAIAPEQVEWRNMMSPHKVDGYGSDEDLAGFGQIATPMSGKNPRSVHEGVNSQSPSGYESLRDSDFAVDDPYHYQHPRPRRHRRPGSDDIKGLESIYRFLAECDEARK
ncbi:MAG: hypothetical protein Q9201_001041 [Fulgogasparrea decipioides]